MQPERSHESISSFSQQGSFSVLSLDGLLQSLSSDFLKETGWNEQDWIGKPISLLVRKNEFNHLKECFEKALSGTAVPLGCLPWLTSNGSYLEFTSSFVPRIESGVIDILWLVHHKDNGTALRWASQSARVLSLDREGERDGAPTALHAEPKGIAGLLQTLIANAPVGIALLDEQLKVICLNQTFCRMTGSPPEGQLGHSVLSAMPRVGILVESVLKKVLSQGHPETDWEIPLKTFAQSDISRWALLSFYPLPDGAEGYCSVAIVAVDITDRKRAEKALLESENRFRLAVDATKLGTWDLNFQTGRTLWSDRARAIFGVSGHTVIDHKAFFSMVHPNDRERVQSATESAKDPLGGGDYQVEFRIIRKEDGSERWVSSRGKVCFDTKGAPLRFVGTTLDITERKSSEEALRILSEDLARSNSALATFAHTASHDLKEPLRMIRSYVQILASRYKGKLDEDANEYIGFVENGAARMAHLIDSILEYAAVGTAVLKQMEVDCNTVMKACLCNLRVALEESQVSVTYDRLPVVLADEDMVLQVFQNLLGNAIKFRSKVSPRIHVSATLQENKWLFSVRDNGIGIRSDFVEVIFSPFRKLHSTKDYSGSGLGLAICRQNIERQRGRIWVTSEEGKGSNFHFTLSAVAGEGNSKVCLLS